MSHRFKRSFLNCLVSLALGASMLSALLVATATPAAAQSASGRSGVSRTINGTQLSLTTLRARAQATSTPVDAPPKVLPLGTLHKPLTAHAASKDTGSGSPSSVSPSGGGGTPQTVTDQIYGPSENDEDAIQPFGFTFVPPDTMGTVGPNQFVFTENGVFQFLRKTGTHGTVFQTSDVGFWGPAANPAGVSDPRVRYDRQLGIWYITQIDVPNNNNDILLGVSSGPDLSTASWTVYTIPATGIGAAQDQDCFADYDTIGFDHNAIYIGINLFGSLSAASSESVQPSSTLPCDQFPGAFFHTNLYVISKTGIGTNHINVTSFYDLSNGGTALSPWTPQGVETLDNTSVGYVIGPDLGEDSNSPFEVSHLDLMTVNNPGSATPTLGTTRQVTIPTEVGTIGNLYGIGVLTPNSPTRGTDDLDDRLYAAMMRNGQIWTAHNLGVDKTGNTFPANPNNIDRDANRWYEINASTATITQMGTVSDTTTATGGAALNYWMGTIMVSGQGHAVMGENVASQTATLQGGVTGRLSGDASGTLGAFTPFVSSTNDNYTDAAFNPRPFNRWGDYTYTSLDPCDDMTMWTVQEYVSNPGHVRHNGVLLPVGWQVRAAKLQAPGPALIPASLGNIPPHQSGITLNVVGTSPGGQGFYDTPASADINCRTRLTASVTNGVKVTNITFTDPTHLTLTLDTTAITAGGAATLVIANPDGQFVTSQLDIAGLPADTVGVYRVSGGNHLFLLRNTNTTGNADIVATYNVGTQPYPIVGDWAGSGFDTLGIYDRSNGLFALRNSNTSGGPDQQLTLGNPNDEPIAGAWALAVPHDGVGVFRPSNGLIFLKNALTSGNADFTMILGIPGDQGLAHDWTGKGFDSPGIYRPSAQLFALSDQVCNCSVFADHVLQLGNPGDSPLVGDWVGQGHSGAGVFRPTNGLLLLKDQLSTGFADLVIVYGIPNDVPIAGHWSANSVTVKSSPPSILVNGPQTPATPPPSLSNLGG